MSFDIELPSYKRPYAIYKNEFQPAKYFLEEIEKLKTEKKTFQFIVSRKMPSNKVLFDTNMKVTLEEYTVKEEEKEGFDIKVSIKLKQYREYATKTMQITIKQYRPVAVETTSNRATNTAPTTRTYTVVRGDCLWNIAKRYYGDGSQYTKIYNANKDKIKKPSLIYPRTGFCNSLMR